MAGIKNIVNYSPSRSDPLFRAFLKGEISENQFWKKTLPGYNIGFLKSAVRELFIVKSPEIPDIVKKLKENNYKVGLLSDHAKEWAEYTEEKFRLKSLFDSCVYSCDVGAVKFSHGKDNNDSLMFETIENKLEVAPDECVFIDDSAKNLKTAEKRGMKTIKFENSEQLIRDLRGLQTLI